MSQTDRLLAAAEKAMRALADHLGVEFAESGVVSWQLRTLERLPDDLRAAIGRELVRRRRVAENAADRAVRMGPKQKWEPYELEAAAKMGFPDPADWRAYMTDKQAMFNAGKPIPTPEEWRADR